MKSDFLSEKELSDLVKDINEAENLSSGEIRIHIDAHQKIASAEIAFKMFLNLDMDKTKERNAVLFYINFEQKYLTIIGDKEIHAKVKQKFWDELHDAITLGFKQQKYYNALQMALQKTGIELKKHFPIRGENPNELSNEISFS